MIKLSTLIYKIPDGRKSAYLGKLFIKSLSNYFENLENNIVDLDQIIEKNINSVIKKDKFIIDLKLFAAEELNKIFLNSNLNLNSSIKDIRNFLILYFEIKLNIDDKKHNIFYGQTECDNALHDFQERIRRKVINLIFKDQKRFLIHMPTGSGKTRTAAEIILDFIRLSASKALLSDRIKILWVAQSSELCQQACETIKSLVDKKGTSNLYFGHLYEESNLDSSIITKSAIIFCSIQKLYLHFKEGIWSELKKDIYLVIVDEAHRSVASNWINALDYFVNDSSVYLLGLTATPGISSGSDNSNYSLATYYHGNKISISDENYSELNNPIQYLIEREYLADVDRIDIDSNYHIKSNGYNISNDEIKFNSRTLEALTANSSRNNSIVNIIRDNFQKGKKILVFTCSVEHNKVLQFILSEFKIESDSIDANSKDRNTIINKFKNGDLNVLLNFGVLTTGFDAPRTDVCIIARPISSIVMYSQMVGRILRGPKNGGNKQNILYTIKDNLDHGDYDTLFNSFNNFYK